KSKALATALAEEAERRGLSVRRPKPGTDYWTQNLAICRDTKCPAALTENLFMDNREDLEIMLSDEGIETIADIHVEGILKYIKNEL
ncbi:MAG: N-acetylmuramoyl-L-alanine amidase, partial [Clostridium sp.]|nr:N-acetylmuramoyl-L-alanine amidase [Clostridium sp.]